MPARLVASLLLGLALAAATSCSAHRSPRDETASPPQHPGVETLARPASPDYREATLLSLGSPTPPEGSTPEERTLCPSTVSPHKQILFDSEATAPLFTVSASGADPPAIVGATDGMACFHPDWSPDGTSIAVACYLHGNTDIYRIAADGMTLSRLTDGPDSEQHPLWAPDGSRIAFLRRLAAEPYGWQLLTMRADGTAQVVVATEPSPDQFAVADTSYSWSPDGTRIAFYADTLNGDQIFVVNADGTGLRQLTRPRRIVPYYDYARWPSWSPDGTRVVFERAYGLSVIGADGLRESLIVSAYQYYMPEWAPDGRAIAFIHGGEGEDVPLYVYYIDAATIIRLNEGVRTLVFEWSPDGCHIAFVAGRPDQWTLSIADIQSLEIHDVLHFPPSSQVPSIWGMSWEP